MTLLNTLRGARASVEDPRYPMTSSTLIDLFGGPKAASGVGVSEGSSLGMPAVWRAVNLIAGTSASLPLHPYRRADDVRLPVTGGKAAELIDDPHPDMTPMELWEGMYFHLLLWGNAYFRILYNRLGQVVELWLLHPSRVRVGRESEAGRKIYQIDGDPEVAWFDDKILHIPGPGYDGICGVSPIRLARQGIGLALAAEEYGARLFGSGSLMAGILQTEQRLEGDQADTLKARWKARVGGLEKAHEVAVLDSGVKFQQLSIPPQDAQFVESRKFQIEEVARMYGIPPVLLAQTEKSTSWGSGIEQQMIAFVQFTLRPWLTRVEQRLTKLLKPSTVYAKYSVEGLLRGDSAARSAFYTAMFNLGALSTNDILRLEDRPPIGPDGDVRYRPLNMGVLGQPDQPEPAPEPAPVTDSAQEPADA
jgi:HK97 family phage portal protein